MVCGNDESCLTTEIGWGICRLRINARDLRQSSRINEANLICSAINGILAMREFKDKFGTTCHDEQGLPDICSKDSSLIVAILSAGTVVGALIAAPTGDSFGRRWTLLLSVGVFCIGAIFQVCAQSVTMLLVGR